MGRRKATMFIALNFSSLLLALAIYWLPFSALRVILGIPFLLFVPGYTLVAALFTRAALSRTERLTLSFCLSLAVVPSIGLILNYTPWGIRLEPVLFAVSGFILITSMIAWFRQRQARAEIAAIDRFVESPNPGKGVWDRVLAIGLVVAVIGAAGTISSFVAGPKRGEVFTQFYILKLENEAGAPKILRMGQAGSVILVIKNHEGTAVSYRIQVSVDGEVNNPVERVLLQDTQEWQASVSFLPRSTGENKKVEFYLFKNDETSSYLGPLYVWVSVK